ncbi:MAG: DUF5798 family protein [Haloarculaceae archaeon]
MAFGGATKKLQQAVDMAEKVYKRLDDLRQQLQAVRERVEDTNDRVERIERELDDQRALLTALADQQGVDIEQVLTGSAIGEAETAGDQTAGDQTAGDSPSDGPEAPEMDTPTDGDEADGETDETFE